MKLHDPHTIPADATRQFLGRASLEITPRQVEKLPVIVENFAPGSKVYIALVDIADKETQLTAAEAVRAAGFEPVPHVPARFIKSEDELKSRIEIFTQKAGVTTMLVLGGGAAEPVGCYDAAIQMLETGLFQAHGVQNIGIAGHPEGNPDITKSKGEGALLEALKQKQAWLKAHGLKGHIATQFLFEAEPVHAWAHGLRKAGIDLPIRVGVPGPATIKTLVKYATMCGIGNSARFIRKQALNITKLLTVSTPDAFVQDLATLHFAEPDLMIDGPHLYPFGGFDKLFAWAAPLKA